MIEWFKVPVLKTGMSFRHRGFESHPVRIKKNKEREKNSEMALSPLKTYKSISIVNSINEKINKKKIKFLKGLKSLDKVAQT